MPKEEAIRIVLLVEDEALECFIRRVMKLFGFRTRVIRVERSPNGQGSAKHWVRSHYTKEVSAYRKNAGKQKNIGLVVGADADELEVVERVRALDDGLIEAGLAKRESAEKICLIIPKYEIETWLVHLLTGAAVDEGRAHYKNDPILRNFDYAKTAAAFVERYRSWKQGNVIETTPPSMITAFEEMKRFGL